MSAMASQITGVSIVYSTVCSDTDQRKHQSSALLAFVRGSHRGRWLPRTKGQWRGKCFHLMTSSWIPSYPFYPLPAFLYRAVCKRFFTFSQSNWAMNFVLLRRGIHPPVTRNQQTEDFAAFLEFILLKGLNAIPLYKLYDATFPVESK